jgi:hypothetical protein
MLTYPIGLIGSSTLTVLLSASTNDYNLGTALGLAVATNILVIIDSGVIIGSTSTSIAAFNVGTLPAGSKVVIINRGTIRGKGGAGGAGGSWWYQAAASAGSAGGAALLTTIDISVTNTGKIAGGGGGGGGYGYYGGSPGDKGGCDGGYDGSAGSAGAGSSSGTATGNGGNEGVVGTSGSTGGGGGGGCTGGAGGGGGGAGNYINGNSFVTWLTTGTRLGGII